jgi:hypothetical protein
MAAKARNALFAGVENANECWTGNVIRGQPNSLSDCNKACNGNKTEICGGLSRLNIYQDVTPTTKWLSLGCYTTSSDAQTLSIPAAAAAEDNKLTIESCQLVCSSRGYIYAGVTGGRSCLCDNAIKSTGVLDPEGGSGCNVTCSGSSTQICGGMNGITVFLQASL